MAATLAVLATTAFEKASEHGPAAPHAAPAAHAPAFTVPPFGLHPTYRPVGTAWPRSSRAGAGRHSAKAGATPPPGPQSTHTAATHGRTTTSWKSLAKRYGTPGWVLKLAP